MDSPRNQQRLRIALGFQARVGKDTFAEYAIARFGGHQLAFAKGVYALAGKIQEFFDFPIEKDPGLLQLIGTGMRDHYSPDIWIRRVNNQMQEILAENPNANILITDMRFPNEMEFLKSKGFTTIKITRTDRPIDRNANHISETALANASFDIHIENNGSLDEFSEQINNWIETIISINSIEYIPRFETEVKYSIDDL